MQRINAVVGTLRITVVGVALSVTPIFNSAHAQQNGGQANLIFEVQNLRQEIAELRDMVERQQFQMRKLQRQLASQPRSDEPQRGYDNRPVGNFPGANTPNQGPLNQGSLDQSALNQGARDQSTSGQSTLGGNTSVQRGSGTIPPAQAKPEWEDVGINPEYQPVVQGGRPNADTYSDQANGSTPANGSNPAGGAVVDQAANANYGSREGVEERVINAPPLDRNQAADNYPPVVDRSIGRPVQNVPVTGAGTQSRGSQEFESQTINTSGNTVRDTSVYSQDLPGTNAQAPRAPQGQRYPSGGGVIAVPTTQGSADGAIVANTVPVGPSGSSASTGSAGANNSVAAPATTNSAAPVAASGGLTEVEFYNQGFELLKQSKYEEASTVFEQQIAAYPRGDRADDAHYWISEAMHVSRKLDVAKVHLKTIIKDFPQSNRLPDAMLKTAYIEQSQGNQIEARILFQEIVNYHPKSDAAIAAKNQLASSN